VLIKIYGYNPTTNKSASSNESAIVSFAYVCSVAFDLLLTLSLLPLVNIFTNKKYRKEVKTILGF